MKKLLAILITTCSMNAFSQRAEQPLYPAYQPIDHLGWARLRSETNARNMNNLSSLIRQMKQREAARKQQEIDAKSADEASEPTND